MSYLCMSLYFIILYHLSTFLYLSRTVPSAPDDLTQAVTEEGKAWPLRSLSHMLAGFQRVQAKTTNGTKPERAFVEVFGTRKKWARQTYNDNLNFLKDVPRNVVQDMLAAGDTWAALRKVAKKYQRR